MSQNAPKHAISRQNKTKKRKGALSKEILTPTTQTGNSNWADGTCCAVMRGSLLIMCKQVRLSFV